MVLVSFIGDISLNDDYNRLFDSGEKPFSEAGDFLSESDLVVGNLECFAEGNEGVNILKKPRLKTNPETLAYLKDLNIGMVSLANNHAFDNLNDGFSKTLNFLEKENIQYLGAGFSEESAGAPLIKEIKGINMVFMSYVSYDTKPAIPQNERFYLNYLDQQKISRYLTEYSKEYFVVLMLHWGGKFENALIPHSDQRNLAHSFIDQGADLIIGHHSHTFQTIEKYQGKYIIYSLGNFCFADIHSDGRVKEINKKRFLNSAIIQVRLDKKHYTIDACPIRNTQLFIRVLPGEKQKFFRKQKMLGFISRIGILYWLYKVYFNHIEPAKDQLIRKDTSRSFWRRVVELDRNKIKQLFNSRL